MVREAQAGRLVTVWPPELRQWARSDRGEVIKVERKIAALLAEGERGTSVSLPKPMPRPVRRLVHMLAEYYGLNAFS